MAIQNEVVLERGWELDIGVDRVLWGQGADPEVVRQRRPLLLPPAERALGEEARWLKPTLLYRPFTVEGLRHERLDLGDGGYLRGPAIVEHLAWAETVIVMVFSVGVEIDRRVNELMKDSPAYALAVDGMGNGAVDALACEIHRRFQADALDRGWQISPLLSPGMVGWPLEVGQSQIEALINPKRIGVTFHPSGLMTPRKTLSGVVGLGSELKVFDGSPCEYCAVRETCRYQRSHA
jgi:hypothetical protein